MIWIIDDRAGRAHSLQTVLQASYASVQIASSAAVLRGTTRLLVPQLVLLSDDLATDSRTLCQHIKQMQEIPVLLYAGGLRLSNASYVCAVGADGTLTYPCTSGTLLRQMAVVTQHALHPIE